MQEGFFSLADDLTVLSFNRAAERITGIDRHDALGRKCWEVFHAEVCERDCLLKKTLKTKRQCINKTVHIINKSGDTIPISISTAILTDEQGGVVGGVETFRDMSEIVELRKELSERHTHFDIVTGNHRMLSLFEIMKPVAQTDSPVLIYGESGTGKELFARAIHSIGCRKTAPFVAVNCGALPENLLESELFGYKKGAFTDAKKDKPGRFALAKGGTLFLDEVGELQKSIQVKLLRVLQEKEYEPLGATESERAECRIVAATNKDLRVLVEKGAFREDLYYRIHVVSLKLPPLRERKDDIPLLIDHFRHHYNVLYHKSVTGVSPEALTHLLEYTYPGNVRELQNILQHAFVLCQGTTIERHHLPDDVTRREAPPTASVLEGEWEQFERNKIVTALTQHHFHRTRTARYLGMHPSTLWRKMKKLNIS